MASRGRISRPGKENETPIPRKDDPLYFLIRHIFLPPKLPHRLSSLTPGEQSLLEMVHHALARFRECLDATQIPALDRCVRMVQCTMDVGNVAPALSSPDVRGRQIVNLKDNDCLAMPFYSQNAGLLITRVGADLLFEALELLAPDNVVTSCEGRLRRSFPSRAVVVARSLVIDPAFLQPFLNALCHLGLDKACQPDDHEESGRPRNPRLVNDMVMGVLRGIGRSLTDEHARIFKHTREEALMEVWPPWDEDYISSLCRSRHSLAYITDSAIRCWRRPPSPPLYVIPPPPPLITPEDETQFWRRSPLWLLTRVALQLTLHRSARQCEGEGGGSDYKKHAHLHGRPLYKAFMVFLMSCVLEKAADKHMPHDLLFFMKAKLGQRVLKLGPAAVKEAWYGFPREVLRRVDAMLAERWDAAQSLGVQALPLDGLSRLDFVRDTQPTLGTLKAHLASIRQRMPVALDDDVGVHNHPFRRTEMTEAPSDTFSGNGDLGFFELFAVENWVENHVQLGSCAPSAADGKEDGATVARSQDTRSRGDGGGADQRGSEGLAHALFGGQSEDGSRWLRFVDNTFAKTFLAEGQAAAAKCPRPSPPRLCDRCSALPLHDEGFEFLFSPLKKSDKCDLCKMIYPAVWPGGVASNRPVRVRREGTNLWADGESRPVLRLCAGPEWKGDGDDTIQIGLPQLLERRANPTYDRLLRSWLRLCDDSHRLEFGCHTESETALPTRVIDVGKHGNGNPDLLRLVCTKASDRARYVALSHRWGKPGEETRRNCTFEANLEERRRRIDLAKLGKTFQDAVTVTRAIGQRYLWIDSLCIVQDDAADLEREFKRMETIFSLAYCVIAATAAEGPDTGFLKSRPPTRPVALPVPSSGPRLYLCAAVDDFHGDVEDASLSRRGWVLQERALARRTIHFSAGQTYWECGRGIHCESLSMLNNREARFLGDPQFPKLALEQAAADNARHRVFQAIFKTYSRLELTHATDRPNAVAGLERRLAHEMGSLVAFGVFDRLKYEYLHRSLLWRRTSDSPLQWINYPPHQRAVPTWSWMAHMGPIDYVDVAGPNEVEWNPDISLKIISTGAVELVAPVTAFNDKMLPSQGLLVLDALRTADIRNLKCIVVANELPSPSESQPRGGEAYYILVVSRVAQGRDASIQYQRLGVATVRGAHLALERGTERAQVI